MDTQVTVTLTALNGELITPSERVITLTPNRPYFPIGRASKSLSKGLQGATDNAWFDSPVMSRDHAEICMNFEDHSLTMQDIGSMHGTRLNGSLLQSRTPAQLGIGDILVFGAEVKRGAEIFPACSFQIHYEIAPCQPNNTFAFPESSDIEDEEDYDLSDNEDMAGGYHNNISSNDGAFIESPPQKLSQAVTSVDLTKDESPASQSRDVVDLTGETPAERRISELMDSRPADVNNRADPVSIAWYTGRPPIVIDSEDDGDFSTDSESDSGCESLDAATSVVLGLGIDDDTDEDEDEDEDHVEEPVVEESFHPESRNNLPVGIIHFDADTIDKSAIDVYDEDACLETSDDESDGPNDLGLSEAADEGMKIMIENGLLRSDYSAPVGFDSSQSERDNATKTKLTPNHISSDNFMEPIMHQPGVTAANATIRSFLGNTLNRPSLIMRHPSPSDAAMVKSAAPSQQAGMRFGTCMLGEIGSSSAEKLGDKSGKTAYFEAREVNKAKFQQEGDGLQELSPGVSTDTETDTEWPNNDEGSSDKLGMKDKSTAWRFTTSEAAAALTDITANIHYGRSMSIAGRKMPTMSTREACAFLDSPDQNLLPSREASPMPDMTSAVIYNNSKETLTGAAAVTSTRSGIKIMDIIENTASPQIATGRKRKADDISSTSAQESRAWSINPSIAVASTTALHPLLTAVAEVTGQSVQDANHIMTPCERHPTKRRRILEGVGYIGLGAITAVASLFAALVATAPEFN